MSKRGFTGHEINAGIGVARSSRIMGDSCGLEDLDSFGIMLKPTCSRGIAPHPRRNKKRNENEKMGRESKSAEHGRENKSARA
jgi:hypothetical protein